MSLDVNKTKFFCLPELDNLEIFHARDMTSSSSRHTHETLTLGIIERGSALLRYKGKLFPICSGSVVVINPDDAHACHPENSIGYSQRIMYPSIALLEQANYELTGRSHQIPLFQNPIIYDEKILRQVQRLFDVLETTSSALEQESQLLQTLICLIRSQSKTGSSLRVSSLDVELQAVTQVREYLEENYIENLSLRQLATLTNLSPFHLNRLFSHSVGLPPHLYLTQVRVLRAKKLLSQGLAIAQVAQDVGFSHQSHLNRHFKKIVGVTPKQYQNSKNVQD